MRKRIASALFAGALALFLAAPLAARVPAGLASASLYHETFADTARRDAARTTALWDTAAGQLRLPAPLPGSEYVHGQLYDSASWSAAVHVAESGRIYLFDGSGAGYVVQVYDPAANRGGKLALGMPVPLVGTAAVYAPSRQSAYLFGGSGQALVVVLNLEALTSTVLADRLPAPLSYAAAVYVPEQDKAYIFGGSDAAGAARDTILQYDLATNTAITLPVTLPLPVTKLSAIYDPLTHSAYLFGGESLGYMYPVIWQFDVDERTITSVGSLPLPCSGAAAVYIPPDKAYLFGGMGSSSEWLDQIVEFDIGGHTATTLPAQLPSERTGAAAAYVPALDTVFILGGQYGPFVLADVVAFDVSQGTVDDLTVGWDGRDGASGAYVPARSKAYLFGGQSGSGVFSSSSIVAYDRLQGTVSTLAATLPSARRDTAAAYVPTGNRIYVFGGLRRTATGDVYFNDILRFDVASEGLSAAGVVLPSARAGMSAVHVPEKGKVYLFGGVGDSGALDEILAYDPAQNQLTTLAGRLPQAAAYAAAAYDALAAKVYLFGGWSVDGSSETYFNQIVAFDVNTETAELLAVRLPQFMSRAAAFAIAGESTIYVIGGSFPGRGLSEIYRFDPLRNEVTLADMELSEARAGEVVAYVPEEAAAYLFGGVGSRVQPLYNIGVLEFAYPLSATAQSLKVSQPGEEVHEALLYAQQSLRGGTVSYSLSNNGGQTWSPVYPGIKHEFPAAGSDLRWRAVLSGNGKTTPIVDSLSITYDHIVQYRLFLPVMVRAYHP